MDLPVKLVELLKHADVEGNTLTWNLQVNASAVTVRLIWIKIEKRIATIGEVTSQAPKKKHLSPSTRKRNAQRLNQWKAKRNQAVVNIKVHAEAQTDNLNTQINDTTQTEKSAKQSRPRPQHTTQSIAKEGTVHAEQKSYQRQAIDAYEVSK